jgi:tRNA (cmo5U34)-methyltransferase
MPVDSTWSEAVKDRIFAERTDRARDFAFDEKVAVVFDDMVGRSVPFYDEIQRMTCELTADFAAPESTVVDLGCSTGTTLLRLDSMLDPTIAMVGIDNAQPMLDHARLKLAEAATRRQLDLRLADIEDMPAIRNASVVLMVLTLQFVRPLHREKIAKKIHDGLNRNGVLIIVEKLLSADSMLNRLFIEHYYDYKRSQGYSDIEITQKREALENVLIPYRMEENADLLKRAGFTHVEDFFRWYNFSGIIAVKR